MSNVKYGMKTLKKSDKIKMTEMSMSNKPVQ